MARKYFLETFGCQMNFHDGERIAGLLEVDGYERTDDERAADLVVINTCSVRERAEEKLYTRLGEIREASIERGTRPVVAVTVPAIGCSPPLSPMCSAAPSTIFCRATGSSPDVSSSPFRLRPAGLRSKQSSRFMRSSCEYRWPRCRLPIDSAPAVQRASFEHTVTVRGYSHRSFT